MDDDSEKKISKGTKECNKNRSYVQNYKHCLFNDKIILKSQQRFKSNCHNVCTEQNQ